MNSAMSLKNQTRRLVDAIKTGVVLFGQEKFIKFMKTLYKNEFQRSQELFHNA